MLGVVRESVPIPHTFLINPQGKPRDCLRDPGLVVIVQGSVSQETR